MDKSVMNRAQDMTAFKEKFKEAEHSIETLRRKVEERDKTIVKMQEDLRIAELEARPRRERLPDERKSITRKFKLSGENGTVKGYATVGFYPDGRPGELFIVLDRAGSTSRGFSDAVSVGTSMLLQHGVPLEDIARKYIGTRFEPSGFTGEGEDGISSATSVLDYVFRWMMKKFGEKK